MQHSHALLLRRLWNSPYLRQSSFYAGLQMVAQMLLGSFQVWALAHYLPRESYGIWGYCGALAAIVSLFTLPGMGQVVTYGAARQYDGVLMAAVRVRLAFGTLTTLSLLGMALAHFLSGEQQAAGLLLLTALFLPAQMALDSMDAFLAGLGNFRALFWRRLLAQGSMALALWIGVSQTSSLLICGAILYGGGLLVSLILFLTLLKHRRNRDLPDDFKGLSQQFSWQSIGSTIGYNMERPLLSFFTTFNEMAAYNLALAAQLPVGMGRLVERILVSRLADRRLGISPAQVLWGMGVLFGLGALGYALLVPLLYLLIPLLLPHYEDAIPLMAILLLQMPSVWATSLGMSWLLAQPQNHLWYHRITWGIVVARILFITIGALSGGIQGVAWSWVLLEGGHALLLLLLCRRLARAPHHP
ncbi:MAG: hypothetical protein HQL88_00675 [Magnetococcales bacterium]|nr:hypothetical protein [Magnetococcales bacterium]